MNPDIEYREKHGIEKPPDKRHWRHGLSNTRLYKIWSGMIKRCYNPKAAKYPRYGARGITVCDQWRSAFIVFHRWAVQNGYGEDLQIDRIDNDGPYSPENCRWVTAAQNTRNSSTCKLKPHNFDAVSQFIGSGLSFCEISRRTGVGRKVVKRILHELQNA